MTSLRAGAMIGVAIMAAVDTIVFHQVLGWHHFYDRSTSDVALLSDGMLQSVYLLLLVAGFFWLLDLRRQDALGPSSAWAGFMVGLGGFQLFDGLVNHKLLGLHQIRYGVDDLWVYDVAWNAVGGVLLLIGAGLVWWSRSERAEGETRVS